MLSDVTGDSAGKRKKKEVPVAEEGVGNRSDRARVRGERREQKVQTFIDASSTEY